jgi:CRISPR-associated protein Csx17
MSARAVHVHHLPGCQPAPLAHYLKAFGVLRVVARQADADARGWWHGEAFHIATCLDRNALEMFFLETYSPTPLVAPWNGGSGFYPKDNATAVTLIENSIAPRLAQYRAAIASSRELLGAASEKPSPKEKPRLLAGARRAWRGPLLDWLDAAVVLDADGQPSYPPILGTGGNDGRLDFTNNFMQRVCSLFDCSQSTARPSARAHVQLRSCLFGENAPVLESAPAGMYLPGSGGGPNSGSGFAGRAAANP